MVHPEFRSPLLYSAAYAAIINEPIRAHPCDLIDFYQWRCVLIYMLRRTLDRNTAHHKTMTFLKIP